MRLVIVADYGTPVGLNTKAVGLLDDPPEEFIREWMEAHLREALSTGYPLFPLAYRTFPFTDESTMVTPGAMVYPVNRDVFPPEIVKP
jgi:hypothetical protein